jgi:hypothetical protein
MPGGWISDKPPSTCSGQHLFVSQAGQSPLPGTTRRILTTQRILLLGSRFRPGIREPSVAFLAMQFRAGLDGPPPEPAMRTGKAMILSIIVGDTRHECPVC